MRLEKGELLEPRFAEFGERVSLFFHVTTGLNSDPDQDLLAAKGGSGWPFVAILDASGQVLAHHKGKHETPQYEQTLAVAKGMAASMAELGRRAKGGDVGAAGQLLELRIELGHVDAEAARFRLAQLDSLPKAERDRLETLITKAEVGSIQIRATSDEKTQIAAGKDFARMVAAGRIPADEDAMFFWYFTAMYAEQSAQAELYARALAGLRHHEKRLGAGLLDSMEKKLEILRKKL